MAKKKESEMNEGWDKVQPGVLNLQNVSVKDTGRSLSSLYNRQARKLLEPFAEMVREGQLIASPLSTMKMKGFLRDLRQPDGLDGLSETSLTQIYNAFCADLKNVVAVAKADRRYEGAWKRLITCLEISTLDIKKQLGREIRVASGYSWHYSNFAELLFGPLTVTDIWERYSAADRDYHRHGMLSMDVSTRISLCDLFFGKDLRVPHMTAKLPAGLNLTTEDFEQATAADLMILEGVALNGSMLGSNGSISATAVKKVKAQTPISDFNCTKGDWPLDRVELLCLTYFTLLDKKGSHDKTAIDVKRLAKFAVEHMAKWIIGPIFGSFLPAMQGFTKTWTLNSYTSRLTGTVQYILMEAKDQWLDLSNFKMLLLCSTIEGNNNYIFLKLFGEEGIQKAKLVRKTDKEKGLDKATPIDWSEEIGLKFAVHWMKYLCAIGIAELAVDSEAPADDPLEGIRFARLTPLGRYALGIDTAYTPKASAGNMEVEFDPRNGIITIDSMSPYQMFLDKVAKRISPTRFRISVESLLKGCKYKSELEQRIGNLRVILDPEKKPELKKLIDEAMSHTDCAVRDGGYSLIRLRHDLPGLREAILTNQELREMTILAGPAMALVKTHKMERFNTILASYGYLME